MRLLYFILMVFTFVILFQIFWPLILVFGALIIGFIAYVNYKAKRAYKENSDTFYESQTDQTTFQNNTYQESDDSNIEKPINHGSVIDAEYTERSQSDERN
ncbi:hypothetical protein [Anaerorhabdus sp.]|jgi:hypothetical protein|uniref:hypothetical protein n=1 Tax=Anaerorhabdus sp. TaxID=1872524 RepID=UPI002FC95FD4